MGGPIPKPRPCLRRAGLEAATRISSRSYRVALLAYEQMQGLRMPLPSQSTVGGPTPCRRRLNIHRQCPKIGMQKPAYPTLGGSLNPPSVWRIGDVFFLAKHVQDFYPLVRAETLAGARRF